MAPANIVWSGGGADANFTNNANWVGGTPPGAGDVAIFDPSQAGGAANANKDATVDAAITIQGLSIGGTYTGTVSAPNPVNLGSAGFALASGAFTVSGGASATDAGDWLQSGGVFTADNGTVTFSSAVLQTFDSGGATFHNISHTSANTLRLSGHDLTANGALTLSGGGIVDLDNHNARVGALSGTATTQVTLGSGLLTDGSNNASTTFSGALIGAPASGLTKLGTGTLQLAGSSSAFTGTTTVNGGVLQINTGINYSNSNFIVNAATLTDNGFAGNTTVNSGGTAGGTGTVFVATFNSGGTLSPGGTGAIGTLNITGGANALTLVDGAAFLEEVNSAASLDKVNVTGSADLGNSTLNVFLAQNVAAGTVLTILQTSTGVSGVFRDSQGNDLNDGSTLAINGQNFTINYNQGGNNAVTLTAGKINSVVTLVSIQNGQTTTTPSFGQPVTFTFTVQRTGPAPTGTVTFFVDGTPRGPAGGVPLDANGQASISVPADVTYAQFQGGPHTIVGSYSGDSNYASASATLSETVVRAVTTTTVSGVPNPAVFGEPVIITATVTGTGVDPTAPKATGLVDFVDTTTAVDLGTAPVDATGHAHVTVNGLRVGGHVIRADYLGQASPVGPGDQNYTPTSAGNGSGTFTETIQQGTTAMTLTTSQSPITAGQQVTFTAHVSANAPSTLTPAGSVTFVDTTNNVTLGTAPLDQNGDAKLQVTLTKAGTITIQASYNTDNNYATSSATVDETVNPGPTSRFAVVAPASVVAGTPFSFTVTAQDQFQNTTPSYAGIIHFTSSDAAATLPADSPLPGGTGTFNATLRTPGLQTLTATDTVNTAIAGTASIAVKAPLSFAFAVSAVDRQVLMHQLNVQSGQQGAWGPTAPGQFLSVAVGTYGPVQAPVIFGVGLDQQVYEARFDPLGHLVAGWFRLAPGKFSSVVVSSYGSDNRPIVFGIGAPGTGQRVFAARLDANAHLISGWGSFAPGQFSSLATANFGGDKAEVFGISSDRQAYAARFGADGLFIDGWQLVAPGLFHDLAAADNSAGTLELFGVGLDGRAYAATFTNTGARRFGWIMARSGPSAALAQLAAVPDNTNAVTFPFLVFALGTDQHIQRATFDATTGTQLADWTAVSAQLFSQIAAGSQLNKTKLYALGADQQIYEELIDSGGNVEGFRLTAPGTFLEVAVAAVS